jgi:hypothetical protein
MTAPFRADDMLEWLRMHEGFLWWLAAASVIVFVGTIVVVPWLVIRLPSDYFAHRKRHRMPRTGQPSVIRAFLLLGKNVLGGIFVLMGIAMLALPGQGVLTMVVGIMLLDFPGKYRLERWLVTRRPVLRSINGVRRRAGRESLMLQE